MNQKICLYCGANFPSNYDKCFDYFNDVSLIQYSDPKFAKFYIYIVDAHALQHPELHGLKNNFYHLLSLCYSLEFKKAILTSKDIKFLQKRVNSTSDIPNLKPPDDRGDLTINNVEKISDAEDYGILVKKWAVDVWNSWSEYHEFIRNEIKILFDKKKLTF